VTATAPERRAAALTALLEERGCAALICVARSSRDPDLAPFVGGVHLGGSLLIAPAGGAPRLAYFTPMERDEAAATGLALLTPEELELERLARERPRAEDFLAAALAGALAAAGVPPGRVALAGRAPAGVVHAACTSLEASGWRFLAGDEVLRLATKTKTEAEIGAIGAAAQGTAAALSGVAALLAAAGAEGGELWLGAERLRVGRLRDEIAVILARHGLAQPEGNIVAAGTEGAVPHSTGRDEHVLHPGESLIVDLFPKGLLFADCTRTFCVGEPPPALERAHAAVLDALRAAHRAALPGARGWTLQEGTCALLASHGYATPITHPGTTRGYVHGLGHGVGYELHELPSFKKQAAADGVLAVGDVLTLEPGLYEPDEGWAVRLEDLCWMGKGGVENLNPLPYDLDPRAWR
jgi:Xaa-Pro aminopeptidase